MTDPRRTRENLERLSVDVIDGLRRTCPKPLTFLVPTLPGSALSPNGSKAHWRQARPGDGQGRMMDP